MSKQTSCRKVPSFGARIRAIQNRLLGSLQHSNQVCTPLHQHHIKGQHGGGTGAEGAWHGGKGDLEERRLDQEKLA